MTSNHHAINSEMLLQTLLHELKDGVIVCNHEAEIVLFNQAAADMLVDEKQQLNIGTSLFTLCLQDPVKHALKLLHYQLHESKNNITQYTSLQFINASANQEKFFNCCMSTMGAKEENEHFIVIIFEDVSNWYRPDSQLYLKIDEFRAPMTNLRAAVESLTEHPEISPVMRSAFENVLVQESLKLSETFESLDRACSLLMQTQSHLTEISSDILCGFIADHFHGKGIEFTVPEGQTVNVKVDTYGLILVLGHLTEKIQLEKKLTELLCTVHIGNQFIFFDFIWAGDFIPTAVVQDLLEDKIENSVGGLTIAGILHSMGGDIWSQEHDKTRSKLRLALPLVMELDA